MQSPLGEERKETFVMNDSSNQSGSLLKRVKFTKLEDEILLEQVEKFGAKRWSSIAKALPGRTSRQCRDRFMNYLNKTLVNGPWTKEEELILEQKYREFGPQWSRISTFFPGRSSNNIKNRWYTHVSKRLAKQQIQAPQEVQMIQKPIIEQRVIFPPLCPDFNAPCCIDNFLGMIEQVINRNSYSRLITL